MIYWIYSSTLADHILHSRAVLEVLRTNKLYAKLTKCSFGQQEIEYLGHIISKEGVATDPQKLSIIKNWPLCPSTITQLRAFLGLTGYYRRFLQDYGVICKPLYDALMKDSFQWTDKQTQAFQALQKAMISPPVLALPDFNLPFVPEPDANGQGTGAVS